MRYFLDISYQGSTYHGWQIQKNAVSVQEVINQALSTILRYKTDCLGSGRTDSGVHAVQQVAHFDTRNKLDVEDFRYKLNALLPPSIAINHVKAVNEVAHARFDASKRSYQYLIHRQKDPFKEGLSYFFSTSINLEKIQEAIKILREWTNFQAFSKVKTDVNNFDCQIFHASWETSETDHRFFVSANRFLRGMVRAMVGTLLEVGQEKITLQDLIQILESEDRSRAGRAVPPEGLYLCAIEYPKDIFIDN